MPLTALPALATVALLLLGTLGVPAAARAQSEAPTPTELTYLSHTQPFRDQFSVYQEQLAAHLHAATEGQHDSITVADLGNLSRELFAARQAFHGAVPSARLDLYHRTIALALDRAYGATVLLIRANVTDSLPEREALILEASAQEHSSRRLFQDAADELHTHPLMTAQ